MRRNLHLPWVLVLFVLSFMTVSCYKEYISDSDYQGNQFKFYLKESQEQLLYNSRGEHIYVEPLPTMYYGGVLIILDKFSTRGQDALNVRRKSFSVNVDGQMGFYNSDSSDYNYYEKFKLLSMPFDYTYIENRFSHYLLEELGLWSLHSFYTELYFNNNHQGLYLFIEDPVEYAFKNYNAHFVLRRYHDHSIKNWELNNDIQTKNSEYYIEKYNHIYELLVNYNGKQLYDSLQHHINLENYMKKMALELIVGNGDYTDELFIFAYERRDGSLYFDFIPWDYDDIFLTIPHEVGREGSTGQLFGERVYITYNDWLNELNGRLVFSIEDDFDYKVLKDDFLYSKYLENLEWTLNKINEEKVHSYFEKVKKELLPYYEIPEVIFQSNYDWDSTNYELFLKNLPLKETFMKERRVWIKEKLQQQKSLMGI